MTTTTEHRRAERIGRLGDSLTTSIRVSDFMQDEAVVRMFEALRANQISIMINAAVEDDATRRGAALKLQALNELRHHLTTLAQSRDKLEQKLEELTAHGA